jgi:hypothetical protein
MQKEHPLHISALTKIVPLPFFSVVSPAMPSPRIVESFQFSDAVAERAFWNCIKPVLMLAHKTSFAGYKLPQLTFTFRG